MDKRDLTVEVTREEFENLQYYKESYFSFVSNPDNSVLESVYYYDINTQQVAKHYEIHYCTEALKRIENAKIKSLDADNKTFLAKIDLLEKQIFDLKNRNLIQRILNK